MDLRSRYLGLELENPFVASSTPLSKNLDTARQLEDAGAGALVMHSLFQEEIEANRGADIGNIAGGDILGGTHTMASREEYLAQFRQLRAALDIPVIPSLNGSSAGDWVDFAAELEAAGAPALELNVYYVAADITESAASVERRVLDIFTALAGRVDIPVGIKLSPYFSSLGKMVTALEASGAAGVALFNRFYQPNIDLESLSISDSLELSTSGDSLLAMRWIAILHGRVQLSLAATGGIHFAEDALKMLLCGADVTYLGSTLLANGPGHLRRIRDNTVKWLGKRGFDSLTQIRGSLSQSNCDDPGAFARGHYLRMLSGYRMK
ncbi:MAG: dihydroorotate dehydrogenase-like protein [Gammaproteobacteria bacterium]|nr:dihydroorotate dehydrogenase-like protein [Gammaproteobacteria bacterium]